MAGRNGIPIGSSRMRASPGLHDGLVHQRLGPQLCSTLGDPCLDKTAGNGQCRVESAIVGFRIGLVENGLQGFQQCRQGQPRQLPGNGGAERSVVHQINRQHEAGIERAMDRLDMRFRNTGSGEVVAAIVLPDQSERTVGLAVVAQRRTALMVIEDARIRIIGAADIVDDAVSPGASHSGARLRMMRACGKSRVRMTLDNSSSAWKPPEWVTRNSGIMPGCALLLADRRGAPDSHCGSRSQPAIHAPQIPDGQF